MKQISLTQGKVALVDDEEFERLNQFKWHFSHGYAVKQTPRKKGIVRKKILMHRMVLNTPAGLFTDHIDGNGLNNQKVNLRSCTRSQNSMNSRKRPSTSSKFKGVYLCNRANPKYTYYIAVVNINGNRITRTMPFSDEGEVMAAKAYNELAVKYFGEFANLNPV